MNNMPVFIGIHVIHSFVALYNSNEVSREEFYAFPMDFILVELNFRSHTSWFLHSSFSKWSISQLILYWSAHR